MNLQMVERLSTQTSIRARMNVRIGATQAEAEGVAGVAPVGMVRQARRARCRGDSQVRVAARKVCGCVCKSEVVSQPHNQ